MIGEAPRAHLVTAALRDMHEAGWPRPNRYTDPFNTADREAWASIAEAIVDDLISRRLVLNLGSCAADNLPRALFLLGVTDEGGPSGLPLPSSFRDWPVVDFDVDADGQRTSYPTLDALEDECSAS